MSNAPYDPYQPPRPIEPKPSMDMPGAGGVRYMYTYSYVFENPAWLSNLFFAALCMLIPLVGPLVLMGYQFELVEFLHRNPGKMYPSFDFNKFSPYLMRGIWPFLASLVCSLPAMIILYAVLGVLFAILALVAGAAGKDAGGIVFGVGMIPFILLEIFLITLINIFIQPFILRAGLSQDFGQTFKFGWVMDFIKKTWFEMILFQLFYFVTIVPMAIVGMLLCFFPFYGVIALVMLAQAHMHLQLYNLFLSRGGEPIPLKAPPPQFAAGT